MTLRDIYNKIFSKTNPGFHPPLAPFLEDIFIYKKNGVVADIGSGRGQNSIFLAAKGFVVDAIDFSEESIKIIKDNARQFPTITPKRLDIKKSEINKNYDIILCNFVLHHFDKEECQKIFSKIKMHTRIGGLNLLSVLVSRGGVERTRHDDIDIFYLPAGKLQEIYRGWEILKFKQEKDETINPKTNLTEIEYLEFMLARKRKK